MVMRRSGQAEEPSAEPESVQQFPWYAVQVRSNFEQLVSGALASKGFESYVPVYRKRAARSRTTKPTELALFPGYVFSRIDLEHRLPVLITPGVVSVVGFGNHFVSIPESQIEAVRAVVESGLPSIPCPFIREGQRVRIHIGSMTGVEGILLQVKNEFRIVVSIELLQRSVAVEIDRACVQPVAGPTPPRVCGIGDFQGKQLPQPQGRVA